MKKRDWLYVIAPLLASWGFDRITKLWASHLDSSHFYGPLGFVLHHNPGAILGLFSELPSVLRVVSLSTGGAFLLFLFGIIQFLLPTKSLTLRIGLSLLISGIIGNVSDRIFWGYVVDFIVVGTRGTYSPAFNFADAIQWVGYGCIVFAFVKEGKSLWPAENLRKSYWINPSFQLKFCFLLMLCGLGLALVLGTFSYTYLDITIQELRGANPLVQNQFLKPFIITMTVIGVSFLATLFAIGLVLSHRAAGPLQAFERFLDDHIQGRPSKLKLRAGDDFKDLERLANKLAAELNPKSSKTKSG